MHAVLQQLSSITVWVHSYTHSQGKVEGNLWVHRQQHHTHTHTLPKKGKKDSISRGANSSSDDDDDHHHHDRPHHHSVCCNHSVILLFCSSSFLQHGHTLNQQIQLLLSLCLFFFPVSFPSLRFPSLSFPSSLCKQDNSLSSTQSCTAQSSGKLRLGGR